MFVVHVTVGVEERIVRIQWRGEKGCSDILDGCNWNRFVVGSDEEMLWFVESPIAEFNHAYGENNKAGNDVRDGWGYNVMTTMCM